MDKKKDLLEEVKEKAKITEKTMGNTQNEPTVFVFSTGEKLIVSPPMWPKHELDIQPGDLTKFTPYGTGVYGYQKLDDTNPIQKAPIHEPSGGVVYFGSKVYKSDLSYEQCFLSLLYLLKVKVNWKDYAVFIIESQQPGKDGYLKQMRIVSRFALRFMFGAINEKEYDSFPEQELTIGQVLYKFLQDEADKWGTSWMKDKGLGGKFGGDGNYACEELAFGFMVENNYHRVYRIWSRAWLVTK